jgi:AcrR family transcriptional regulator
MISQPARSRRSSAELHTLILRAAEELFGARGYEATTTRDIAGAADVTEAAIYRHFGTKEALFEAAIARPYREVIGSFLRSWQRSLPDSTTNAEVTREFVERFYDFVQQHRRLLKTYLAYREYNPQEGDSALSRELDQIERMMTSESTTRGFSRVDIPIAVRCAAGMVLALSLHDDLLFPAGAARPHRDRVVAEAVAFSLRGVSAR